MFRPLHAASAWVIGAGLALPLLGYASPRVIDVDSSWLAISTRYVQAHGIGLLQQNQEVYLPHVLLGPLLRWGGYQAAVGLNIAGVMGVASLAGVLAYSLTRRGVGAVVASASVLCMPALVFQAYRLSLYGPMLVLGYLGCWLVHRSMRTPAGPAWWAAAGGVCLVLASEAHALGRLFLVVPFLLLVLHPHRNAAPATRHRARARSSSRASRGSGSTCRSVVPTGCSAPATTSSSSRGTSGSSTGTGTAMPPSPVRSGTCRTCRASDEERSGR